VLSSALEQLQKFKPDLVAVSAGFDAYARDPLAQETLEAEDFYWLGKSLRNLAAQSSACLKGGYSNDLPELSPGLISKGSKQVRLRAQVAIKCFQRWWEASDS
jgi:acetoin utilization deacetylase AcuC-like enzyme